MEQNKPVVRKLRVEVRSAAMNNMDINYALEELRRGVREAVEYMTGMIVHEVNIRVKALFVQS